ncbi:hypothetical protein QWZ06_24720 [Chryseobacterium tructae]|nr:hypothetical protein [Chryseobacterium tructae]MDN3695204.1 hypothetical protein [Chryseobacterium tructae]
MMNDDEYTKLCLRAHELVKDQTWESYTKKVIELMNNVANKN